ncbi:MAG: 4Fe-4S binding protein [Gemmatimonadota bacterium]
MSVVSRTSPLLRGALVAALVFGSLAADARAQSVSGVPRSLLEEVMPAADRFESKSGVPPVIRAYKGDLLLGFVFETQDIPPEQLGYSGPVRAIVGLGVDGLLTGARVTDYYESYKSSMGDFLRRRGIQEQFAGKSIADPFDVNADVEGVTRATLSTRALARGIRNASRRVAEVYSDDILGDLDQGPIVLEEMSWFEMRTRGVLKRMLIEDPEGYLDISMAYLPNDSIAEFFVGSEHLPRIDAQAARRDLEDPTYIMYALEGPRLRLFLREGWYVEQAGDTLELPEGQVYSLGLTRGGRVDGEAIMVGVFMLDDRIDVTRPFTMMYDLEDHEGHYLAYFDALEEPATVAVAEAPDVPDDTAVVPAPGGTADTAAGTEGASDTGGTEPVAGGGVVAEGGTADPDSGTGPEASDTAAGGAPADPASPDPAPPVDPSRAPSAEQPLSPVQQAPLDFSSVEEASELQQTLASTDWSRVVGLGFVLTLALVAFFLKKTALRYAALTATIVFLGFLDASFLSISHVTAGIWVGPEVFLRDLPLLIMVAVTVVTTLVWGRVFCGVLCPFGALQDMIERVVPKRLRLRVPNRIHLPALKLKYVILAIILVPALLGSRVSLYQYFEPFGTVFFLSPSFLLWSIAAAFLVASAFIPRFYCRYACPLGAGLALASFVSLRRIGRVEQCDVCKVCEQDCPTGAIDGPTIDFKECVRCNRCETNLIEKVGACRHDMAEIRPRLVQLRVESTREGAGV